MALQTLKLPIISRSCSSTTTSNLFFFSNSSSPTFLGRWLRGQRHSLVRSFAVAKSGKIQIPKKRKRLDEICLERFQQYSRTYIQSWILQGKVFVDGKRVSKAGTQVSDKSVVEIIAEVPKYVCRAGHKLEAAVEQLGVEVAGKVALDSGLSTGGFTDCLLQYGASFVYGVDVGYGQNGCLNVLYQRIFLINYATQFLLAKLSVITINIVAVFANLDDVEFVADKIRRDERVSIIERTNLRYLSTLPQKVDLVTLDLSFISILTVMPAVVNLMKPEAALVTLVKPQFEARRSQVGGGGIVRDPLVHKEVLDRIINGVENFGFQSKGWIESPLKGAEGNTEFLVSFCRTAEKQAE
ncbi:hypothetical protein EZV62_020952 [Acer yangbiense]|uniref:RNA-binding S4 domain-containing protein n=1 Tax=Acer yangbiense TaxID=1000413 RepID=A0A5C7HHJ5_9ROSI|nr:hypothetical protein EZV62_020952 [Acer yangbiense]